MLVGKLKKVHAQNSSRPLLRVSPRFSNHDEQQIEETFENEINSETRF